MGFVDIIKLITSEMSLAVAAILISGVVFVNGWTDAPGAITTSVSTGALKMKQAALLAAVFNFIGAVTMGILNTSVARSVGNIALMIGQNENSIIVLCAAMMSIILWATGAWYFGIPTSESHALISGILGAAIAGGSRITSDSIQVLKLAVFGLIFSLPLGGISGYLMAKIINRVANITKISPKIIKGLQITGAASMSFVHGAQDSQKFVGVLIAALCMSHNAPPELGLFNSPISVIIVFSLLIAIGTSVGGYRIIKRVGMSTVNLTPEKALAADISASICMLWASLGGIPVSTTHTGGASIIGAGISEKGDKLNITSLKEMLIAWFLTFPCCGALSYLIVKLVLGILG